MPRDPRPGNIRLRRSELADRAIPRRRSRRRLQWQIDGAMHAIAGEFKRGDGVQLVGQRAFDQFGAISLALSTRRRVRHADATLAPFQNHAAVALAMAEVPSYRQSATGLP